MHPHPARAAATITWKDELISVLAVKLSLHGASRNVDVTGTVSHGLFKYHHVAGRFQYTDVVSTHGGAPSAAEIRLACRNKIPPKTHGRISVNGLTFVTTRPFVIS